MTAWLQHVAAVNVLMNGLCNIYGAGHPTAPGNAPTVGSHGGGLPPVLVLLNQFSNAPVLTMMSSGSVAFCPSCGNFGPDGANFSLSGPDYNGISGITNFTGRGLTAVFTDDSEPSNPAPPSLDFAVIGTNYTQLAPQLRQMFFIGDGVAGGVPQQIQVPPGATRLYFGLVDGFTFQDTPDGYSDNTGSFTVTISPALALVIDLATGKPGLAVYGPINSTNRVEYTPVLPAIVWQPLTNVVIQTSPTRCYDTNATDPARFYRAVHLP